jgi:hypothetical protein
MFVHPVKTTTRSLGGRKVKRLLRYTSGCELRPSVRYDSMTSGNLVSDQVIHMSMLGLNRLHYLSTNVQMYLFRES